MNSHKFNQAYYEDGVRQHISGYENYKWIPQRSFPEALEIVKHFHFRTCVDFGCAKGFLVSALRSLGYEAYGEDISEYALTNAKDTAKPYLSLPNDKQYDLLIAKDILEHVAEADLPLLLRKLLSKADEFFFVIPLGDDDRFRIREYEIDITHVTKKDEEWWLNLFKQNGYRLVDFKYSFGAIKEKWIMQYPHGNGFFRLIKV